MLPFPREGVDILPFTGITEEYVSRVIATPCPYCNGRIERGIEHETMSAFFCTVCRMRFVVNTLGPSVTISPGRPR